MARASVESKIAAMPARSSRLSAARQARRSMALRRSSKRASWHRARTSTCTPLLFLPEVRR
eukprot:3532219-Pyramimonas_sp.AAC.1